MIGWNMVILLAGLQTIPLDYYEAAALDGASYLGPVPQDHDAAARCRR